MLMIFERWGKSLKLAIAESKPEQKETRTPLSSSATANSCSYGIIFDNLNITQMSGNTSVVRSMVLSKFPPLAEL